MNVAMLLHHPTFCAGQKFCEDDEGNIVHRDVAPSTLMPASGGGPVEVALERHDERDPFTGAQIRHDTEVRFSRGGEALYLTLAEAGQLGADVYRAVSRAGEVGGSVTPGREAAVPSARSSSLRQAQG